MGIGSLRLALRAFQGLVLATLFGAALAAAPGSAGRCDPALAKQRAQEHEFSLSGGGFSAFNGQQEIALDANSLGIRFAVRTETGIETGAALTLTAAGPAEDMAPARSTRPRALGQRVEYMRGFFTEWYSNTARGLEPGLTIHEPLTGRFAFEFALGGTLVPKIAEDGRSFRLEDGVRGPVFVYDQLNAHDDRGRDIPASWEPVVDATGSVAALRLTLTLENHVTPYHVAALITRGATSPTSGSKPADPPASEAAVGVDAPPVNDTCNGALVVGQDDVAAGRPVPTIPIDITDATNAGDPPVPSCQSSTSRSVWFKYTPPDDGDGTANETTKYNLSTCAGAGTATTVDDTVLAVYTSNTDCDGTLTQVTGGCDDDSCIAENYQAAISGLALTEGTTYYIVVSKYGPQSSAPSAGNTDVQLKVSEVPPVPENDLRTNALVIAGTTFPSSSAVIADISSATTTDDPATPSCEPNVSRSVWFKFTPPGTSGEAANYEISTCAGSGAATTVDDTVVSVFASTDTTCDGTLTQVTDACDDEGCDAEASQGIITSVSLTAGTTYCIAVHKGGTTAPAAGNTAVQVIVNANGSPPANDRCAGALPIPPVTFPDAQFSPLVPDVTYATVTENPTVPSCQSNVSRSVWFTFTPTVSGGYEISTCAGSGTGTTLDDTVLAVYTSSDNSCTGTFTQVAGGCDDNTCAAEANQSILGGLGLTAGTTYYIVVHKYGPAPPAAGEAAVQVRIVKNPEPPPNDQCSLTTPELILGTPTVAVDVTYALSTGDPPAPSCQSNVSRSVWYTFTPPASGAYRFSTCADDGLLTTLDDTVVAVYTSSDSTCTGTFTQVSGGCDDDSCVSETNQSVIGSISLTGQTKYFVLVHKYGTAAPAAGNSSVQLRVDPLQTPPNDACANAEDLALDTPVTGSTLAAANDFQLPSITTCFTGVGQTKATGDGPDVVYRFTAPDAGLYSFRVTGYLPTLNPVLYIASECPTGTAPNILTGCLEAANRATGSGAEEVDCHGLTPGQQVYVFADDISTDSPGGPFTIEVNRCVQESEENGTPGEADAVACGLEGSVAVDADADFVALGTLSANDRIFAMVDAVAAVGNDFDLRVTTDTATLEYDDAGNDTMFGPLGPNVAGTRIPVDGAAYLRVNYYSSTRPSEPWRLYSAVQPSSALATAEVEPNDNPWGEPPSPATTGQNNYFSGGLSATADVDYFSFTAVAGQMIFVSLDADPTRDGTPFDPALALFDSAGKQLVLVNDNGATSSIAGGAGLDATTPYSPAEGLLWRARSDGTYYVRVTWSSGNPGDYLLSISRNCSVGAADADGDGVPDAADSAPFDGTCWTVPGDATGLSIGPDKATFTWSEPDAPGGTRLVYDLLRSTSVTGFSSPACVAAGIAYRTVVDAAMPGVLYSYLVRTRSNCGVALGTDSNGTPRTAGACP